MPKGISKNQRANIAAAAKAEARGGHKWEKPDCPYCGALSRHRNKPALGRSNRHRVCLNDHGFVYKDCTAARRRNMERKRRTLVESKGAA